MKDDPIVEEIRSYRASHAAKYGNDLDRIFDAIKEREKKYTNRKSSTNESGSYTRRT